jgi:phosphate butyryltransferase
MSFASLKKSLLQAKTTPRIAIALAEGEEIFTAAAEAAGAGICSPVLVGREKPIREQAERSGLTDFDLITASTPEEAAEAAVEAVRSGRADLLMKGKVPTSTLLRAVLRDKEGLRGSRLLSHVAVIELPGGRFLAVTDGGLNIQPGLQEKAAILENAVALFQSLGVKTPKVAVLSAVEVVNPDIPSTLDAAQLAQMAAHGQIKGAVIDGPLALDLAVSPQACKLKKINTPIAGEADILLVPDLVSGNLLGKSLIYLAGYPSGGIVLGAICPIVLLSRSDSAQEKLNSIILGAAYVHHTGH